VIGASAASTSDGDPPWPQKERRDFGRRTRGPPEALPRAARTRRGRATRTGEPACLPAVRPSLRQLWRVTRTTLRKPEIVGAFEAQGLYPAEQISLCWLHHRRAESDAGNAIKLRPWSASRGAEIVTAPAPLRRPPTRQSVAAAPATMRSQNSSLCAGRAIHCFSPHMATKQLCLRVETRRKRSVHSRRLSRRILAL